MRPPILPVSAVLIGFIAVFQACSGDRNAAPSAATPVAMPTPGPTTPPPAPPAPTVTDGMIRGRVIDLLTQSPLPGATVELRTDSATPGVSTVTDGDGRYALPQPAGPGPSSGWYHLAANNGPGGSANASSPWFSGDLIADATGCVSRYGMVLDARTLQPLSGVTLSYGNSATTDVRGWYQLDWGCPASGSIRSSTAFLEASRLGYVTGQSMLGRGFSGVRRLDVLLQPE